jgi:hypothetical protein
VTRAVFAAQVAGQADAGGPIAERAHPQVIEPVCGDKRD